VTYQVIVRPLAERDLLDASAWYDLRRPMLGGEFLDAFAELQARLEHTPFIYPEVYLGVRRAVLRRFPYLVYFVVRGQSVLVAACLHAARDPGLIRRRLREG
jgi:plasmid stabilization system protein ParE